MARAEPQNKRRIKLYERNTDYQEWHRQGEPNVRPDARYVSYSCLKSVTPDKVRIPVFIVVIAAFVTILQLVIKAFLPDIDAALGLFIPLIVVNCIILGRAEAFAAKNSPVASLFDGIGIGLGFTLGLTLLGICRELLGSGSVFGLALIPETYNILLFVLPPGAFITLGFLIAIVNKLRKA